MFNVKGNRWEPGFRIAADDVAGPPQLGNKVPVENPYFPGLAGMSDLLAFVFRLCRTSIRRRSHRRRLKMKVFSRLGSPSNVVGPTRNVVSP